MGASLSWFLDPRMDDRVAIKRVLVSTAESFSLQFAGVSATSDCVMFDNGVVPDAGPFYLLAFATDNRENALHPESCIGAGEIFHFHGKYVPLFFATVKQRLGKCVSKQAAEALTFATEKGQAILLSNLQALDAELARLGIQPDDLLADAQAVGFVETVVHLCDLPVNEPSLFF